MSTIILIDDLRSSLPGKSDEELQQLADDAEALAADFAPCLFEVTFDPGAPENARKVSTFKAIVRRALVYDVAAGDGAVTTTSVSAPGGYSKNQSIDTGQRQSGMLFSPLQIEALRKLCTPKIRIQGAYSVPMGMPGL